MTPDTPPPYPRNLLTVAETAERLGVSQSYVRTRIGDGDLASINLGRNGQKKLRVHPDDLDVYIDRARIIA